MYSTYSLITSGISVCQKVLTLITNNNISINQIHILIANNIHFSTVYRSWGQLAGEAWDGNPWRGVTKENVIICIVSSTVPFAPHSSVTPYLHTSGKWLLLRLFVTSAEQSVISQTVYVQQGSYYSYKVLEFRYLSVRMIAAAIISTFKWNSEYKVCSEI